MPLELVAISLVRPIKWIEVLMLNSSSSGNSKHRRIDVTPEGIRWIEKSFEQFTRLDKFFQINPMSLTYMREWREEIAIRLNVHNVNEAALDKVTINVPIDSLQLQLDTTVKFGLRCSNCTNYVMLMRRFNLITPIPIITMHPQKFFCTNGKPTKALSEDELYYGLNYIVVRLHVLGLGVIRNRQYIHCRRCLQLLGESLDDLMAVQLYADTLWVISKHGTNQGLMVETQLEDRFAPLSVTQAMMQLLPNAVPVTEEKSRLFLKAVRADGQLHYMLLLVDARELHLLRSNLSLSELLSVNCSVNGSSHRSSKDSHEGHDDSVWLTEESQPKRQRLVAEKPVHEIKVTGYRGCRVNYQLFRNDEQLSANSDVFEQWLAEGTPMLRISFVMMMNLMHELKTNEDLVTKIERSALDKINGCLSYIIYLPNGYDNNFV